MTTQGKSSAYRGVTLFRPTNKWRAQISAGGKTTSLGDHDTEEQAAIAFDRASINKAGREAKTNFPIVNYENEIEELQAMNQTELVAMLRSKARKSGTQTSHFRGVSLLKQTNKWHAQINVGGRQVHLGFFPTEESAARAYDRAAINKGAKEGSGRIITNFDISDYANELDLLRRISQDDLVEALSNEGKRKQAMAMLSEGLAGKVETVLGKKYPGKGKNDKDKAALEALCSKAERAQPKSTVRNPLYQNFGKKKEGAASGSDGQAAGHLTLGTTPAGSSGRQPGSAALGTLFAGSNLPSLASGPAMQLPLGALVGASGQPAGRAADVQGRTGKQGSQQAKGEPSTPKPKKPQVSPRGRPPKRTLFPPSQQAKLSDALPDAGQVLPPPTPGKSRRTENVSPKGLQNSKELYGSLTYTRFPQTEDSPGRTNRESKHGGKSIDIQLPKTPPPKRGRAPSTPPGNLGLAALADLSSHDSPEPPVLTLQQRLRQRQEEHKRQEAEQRALLSDVLDHVTARPMTKRQEALAARKKEEAAATLACTRRSPASLPDEVGEALMDFAEAAALAELEDQDQEQLTVDRHRQKPDGQGTRNAEGLQRGATSPPEQAVSEDSRSTITFPGPSRHTATPDPEEHTSQKRDAKQCAVAAS